MKRFANLSIGGGMVAENIMVRRLSGSDSRISWICGRKPRSSM